MTEYDCCKSCAYDPKTCRLLKEPILCGMVIREQHDRQREDKECMKPEK